MKTTGRIVGNKRAAPTSHLLSVMGLMLKSLTRPRSWYMCSRQLSIWREQQSRRRDQHHSGFRNLKKASEDCEHTDGGISFIHASLRAYFFSWKLTGAAQMEQYHQKKAKKNYEHLPAVRVGDT